MERALVVMHFLSFLIAGLSRPKQNLWWLCDNDAIFSNGDMRDKVAALFQRVFVMYLPQSQAMGWYDIKIPADDPADLVLEDLLAIPDLAAGSALEHFKGMAIDPGPLRHRALLNSARSDLVLSWLSRGDTPLAKFLVLLARPTEGSGVVPLWLNYSVEYVDLDAEPRGDRLVDRRHQPPLPDREVVDQSHGDVLWLIRPHHVARRVRHARHTWPSPRSRAPAATPRRAPPSLLEV